MADKHGFFHLSAIRCPGCNASLPIARHVEHVTCEYCGNHVRVANKGQAKPPPPPAAQVVSIQHNASPRPVATYYVAERRMSGWSWLLIMLFVFGPITAGGLASVVNQEKIRNWFEQLSNPSSNSQRGSTQINKPNTSTSITTTTEHKITITNSSQTMIPPPVSQPPATETKTNESPPKKGFLGKVWDTIPQEQAAGSKDNKAQTSPAKPDTPAKVASGPILSVQEAQKILIPKALKCMEEANKHDLLAYMGNQKLGPVFVLDDPRTRVNGIRQNLKNTTMGRCLNEAGSSVRTSALKNNYVLLDVHNPKAPDPLKGAPDRADPKAIEKEIKKRDASALACVIKAGLVGEGISTEVRIDGYTGRVDSFFIIHHHNNVRLRECLSDVYDKAQFTKFRQYEFKYQHRIPD